MLSRGASSRASAAAIPAASLRPSKSAVTATRRRESARYGNTVPTIANAASAAIVMAAGAELSLPPAELSLPRWGRAGWGHVAPHASMAAAAEVQQGHVA